MEAKDIVWAKMVMARLEVKQESSKGGSEGPGG
jgi:hypothetical protein